jgi:hypothetical protein
MGRWLIIIGLVIAGAGVVAQYAPWMVSWFGRLPGDIHFESDHGKVFIPIVSMILVSILLSVILNCLNR